MRRFLGHFGVIADLVATFVLMAALGAMPFSARGQSRDEGPSKPNKQQTDQSSDKKNQSDSQSQSDKQSPSDKQSDDSSSSSSSSSSAGAAQELQQADQQKNYNPLPAE